MWAYRKDWVCEKERERQEKCDPVQRVCVFGSADHVQSEERELEVR